MKESVWEEDKGWVKMEKCNKCLDIYKMKLKFWDKLIHKYEVYILEQGQYVLRR